MKITKCKTLSSIVLFIALWATQTASAWYDPSTQRWLSRDPIGEPGFQSLSGNLRTAQIIESSTPQQPKRWINRDSAGPGLSNVHPLLADFERENLNGYCFVHNNPAVFVDPLGLDCNFFCLGDPILGIAMCTIQNPKPKDNGCRYPCPDMLVMLNLQRRLFFRYTLPCPGCPPKVRPPLA